MQVCNVYVLESKTKQKTGIDGYHTMPVAYLTQYLWGSTLKICASSTFPFCALPEFSHDWQSLLAGTATVVPPTV